LLTSVELDDDAVRRASEIGDERPDRHLAPELDVPEATVAVQSLELPLDFRHLAT